MKTKTEQAALGFRVHTGWAAMIAIAKPRSPGLPTILDRRRVEMIAGSATEMPRFVYHAAAKLTPGDAERLVQEANDAARSHATDALAAAVRDLADRGHEILASGIIAANRPLSATLETILRSHSLIHAAEGELFRRAIAQASEALRVPVTRVPARDLHTLAAKQLGVSLAAMPTRLAEAGRGAGRPWGQDEKESWLVALLALTQTGDL
jgi:hypothetical protein